MAQDVEQSAKQCHISCSYVNRYILCVSSIQVDILEAS